MWSNNQNFNTKSPAHLRFGRQQVLFYHSRLPPNYWFWKGHPCFCIGLSFFLILKRVPRRVLCSSSLGLSWFEIPTHCIFPIVPYRCIFCYATNRSEVSADRGMISRIIAIECRIRSQYVPSTCFWTYSIHFVTMPVGLVAGQCSTLFPLFPADLEIVQLDCFSDYLIIVRWMHILTPLLRR